ncbi:acylphosphatase [Roseisolibacter agri]|uniref:Acylphosphatase n=1 Tax=Roseisolibacter agri TaxID=2014610 RepID=A0AA37QIM5_9BACT|nr:acylphosphatase [Roseisolibacter agri]GLC27210.1 acylphosphatase [Roseisolibacter agri]
MSDPPADRPDSVHVRVEGRVQGVGFRWFVREAAVGLGLSGWVRNLPDGSVEVLAAGDATALATLRTRLAEGPPHARVDRLVELGEAAASPAVGDSFEIVRGPRP